MVTLDMMQASLLGNVSQLRLRINSNFTQIVSGRRRDEHVERHLLIFVVCVNNAAGCVGQVEVRWFDLRRRFDCEAVCHGQGEIIGICYVTEQQPSTSEMNFDMADTAPIA